jgi:hypothetical protein
MPTSHGTLVNPFITTGFAPPCTGVWKFVGVGRRAAEGVSGGTRRAQRVAPSGRRHPRRVGPTFVAPSSSGVRNRPRASRRRPRSDVGPVPPCHRAWVTGGRGRRSCHREGRTWLEFRSRKRRLIRLPSANDESLGWTASSLSRAVASRQVQCRPPPGHRSSPSGGRRHCRRLSVSLRMSLSVWTRRRHRCSATPLP